MTGYDDRAGMPGRAFNCCSEPAVGEPGSPAARRGGVRGVKPPVTLPSESESPELDDEERPEDDSLTARRVGVEAVRWCTPGRWGCAGRGLSTRTFSSAASVAGVEMADKAHAGGAQVDPVPSIEMLSDLRVGRTELVAARPVRRARR